MDVAGTDDERATSVARPADSVARPADSVARPADSVARLDGERAASVAGPDDERAAWQEQRRQAVAGHAAAQADERAAEARAATALLARFIRRAAERGLPPHRLVARTFDGRSTYRTTVQGWYLKSNRSVAVGADGGYYVLTVPSSWRSRFAGADLAPSVPRLIVGAGGGDGETVPLSDLLDRRLEAGVSWP